MKFLTEKKLQKLLDEHTQAAMIDRPGITKMKSSKNRPSF